MWITISLPVRELSDNTKMRFVVLENCKPFGKCLCKKPVVDFSDYLQLTFAQTHKLASAHPPFEFPARLSDIHKVRNGQIQKTHRVRCSSVVRRGSRLCTGQWARSFHKQYRLTLKARTVPYLMATTVLFPATAWLRWRLITHLSLVPRYETYMTSWRLQEKFHTFTIAVLVEIGKNVLKIHTKLKCISAHYSSLTQCTYLKFSLVHFSPAVISSSSKHNKDFIFRDEVSTELIRH